MADPKKQIDGDYKPSKATKAANWMTGINAAANLATGIYGAIQASKMKPYVVAYQTPIEAPYVQSRTEAIKAGAEEGISKAINTSREQQRRLGIADSTLVGKETEALNQLSGQLAQYRTGIDAENARLKAQTDQFNQQLRFQQGATNAGIYNQHQLYKNQIMSEALSGISTNLTSGLDAIAQNINYEETRREAYKEKEKDRLYSIYNAAISSGNPESIKKARKSLLDYGLPV